MNLLNIFEEVYNSQEEFLDMVKREMPEKVIRYRSLIHNRGLEYAINDFNEKDPKQIKAREKQAAKDKTASNKHELSNIVSYFKPDYNLDALNESFFTKETVTKIRNILPGFSYNDFEFRTPISNRKNSPKISLDNRAGTAKIDYSVQFLQDVKPKDGDKNTFNYNRNYLLKMLGVDYELNPEQYEKFDKMLIRRDAFFRSSFSFQIEIQRKEDQLFDYNLGVQFILVFSMDPGIRGFGIESKNINKIMDYFRDYHVVTDLTPDSSPNSLLYGMFLYKDVLKKMSESQQKYLNNTHGYKFP